MGSQLGWHFRHAGRLGIYHMSYSLKLLRVGSMEDYILDHGTGYQRGY